MMYDYRPRDLDMYYFSNKYFRKYDFNFLKLSARFHTSWFTVSLSIDLFTFFQSSFAFVGYV